jgi:hypothetical protein
MTRSRCVPVGEIWAIFHIPGMELKNQLARTPEPIVEITMAMFRERIRPKQFAIPAAACPHIFYGN